MNRSQLTPADLGFVMAIDGCARGCSHCPAYQLGLKPSITPVAELRRRLQLIRRAMHSVDFTDFRTVHCWRISDPLDYFSTEDGVTHDVASVADAWLSILGQPLYVVTNGTMGHAPRQQALTMLAAQPELVSQVKLTITPFDPKYKGRRYDERMAADISILWRLGQLDSTRYESRGKGQRRFRINVKATDAQRPEVVDRLRRILKLAEIPSWLIEPLVNNQDPRLQIKPVYDLRQRSQQPVPVGALSLGTSPADRLKPELVRDRFQLGFRPDGRAFTVDMHGFNEIDLHQGNRPLRFEDWYS